MQQRHQDKLFDTSHIMQLCAQYSDRLHYHAANDQLPPHWKTSAGDILWLQIIPPEQFSTKQSVSVKLAAPSELINNPDVRKGAIALAHQIKHYQQQLTTRSTQLLDAEQTLWAPSVSNKAQMGDLRFGQTLEHFLECFDSDQGTSLSLSERIRRWTKTLCLAIEEEQITVKESRFLFPTPEIQHFKERFNRMMERRIRLLNRTLECRQQTTISYIPLGMEIDCTVKRVAHKLTLLNEIETQSLTTLITQDIDAFANQVANTPHHITELMQPLLNTTTLWCTLWPGKETEVYTQLMIHLQALRLHSSFENHQPRVEGILRKAEGLLKEVVQNKG